MDLVKFLGNLNKKDLSFVYRGGRMSDAPVVSVEQGQLQGRVVNSPSGKAFYSFQGIPYAKPPLGSLRFKVSPTLPYIKLHFVWRASSYQISLDLEFKDYCPFLFTY